jgi:hypothetical protein
MWDKLLELFISTKIVGLKNATPPAQILEKY